MPDHFHSLIGSDRKPSEVLRYLNGIAGHRVIDYLKDCGFEVSLRKLDREGGVRQDKYSLWDHHPNLKLITTDEGLVEKANYIHMNPVRAGLVNGPEDYRFSSARFGRVDHSKMSPSLSIATRLCGIGAEAEPHVLLFASERLSLSARKAAKPRAEGAKRRAEGAKPRAEGAKALTA